MTNTELASLVKEIQSKLSALTAPSVAQIREIRRAYSRQFASGSPDEILKLANGLLRNDIPQFFAYELVQHHRTAKQSLTAKTLESLAIDLNSWQAVDSFACFLAGPAWREGQLSDATIKRWARSKDRWWRRLAVVSTVPLNNKTRGGTGDSTRTIMICEMVLGDRDDMVVKALSWALRELAKRDSEAVVHFIRTNQSGLAPRVIREVNNKLSTGLKNRKQR